MTERLVELIRSIAADHPKDPRIKELIALVGKDGDPHEIDQRHTRGDEKDQPEDSNINADADAMLNGDIKYQQGDGFFISRLKLSDKAFEVKPKFKGWNGKEWTGQFIPERLILEMAKEIEVHRKLTAAAADYRKGLHERKAKNYPGTDVEDSATKGHHRMSDNFRLDVSQSYIYFGSSQGTAHWLNGSAVPHNRFVTMQVGSPDGRELVRVRMTFDQFAAALISHTHVPCTVEKYWSKGSDSVYLTERVRIPPSIEKRMENRLKGRFDERAQFMREQIAIIKASVEAGKAMSKTTQAELARNLEIAVSHLSGTAEFTVHQALEEVSGIVEQAAVHLSQSYGLTAEQIAQAPALASFVNRPALPVPKPKDKQ